MDWLPLLILLPPPRARRSSINVLANDTDVDGNALGVTQISGEAVTAGRTVTLVDGAQATLNADGTITYTPAANVNGAASFGYTVSDGQGGNASTDVGVTIAPRSDTGEHRVWLVNRRHLAGFRFPPPVSRATRGSVNPSISADGRYVTFLERRQQPGGGRYERGRRCLRAGPADRSHDALSRPPPPTCRATTTADTPRFPPTGGM